MLLTHCSSSFTIMVIRRKIHFQMMFFRIKLNAVLAVLFMFTMLNIACKKDKTTTKEDVEDKGIVLKNKMLFNEGETWKYLDDGSDQGTAWTQEEFNDSSWKSGKGHFGFGDEDESVLLKSGFITYYFRKTVTVPDVNQLPQTLFFYMVHDDAAVVYVNGKEVSRSALLPKGPITYLTGTDDAIPTEQENEFFIYEVDRAAFKNGANQIAVEIHNQKVSSSDISFDFYMRSYKETDVDGPYVFIEGANYVVRTFDREKGLTLSSFSNREQVSFTVQMPDGHDFDVKLHLNLVSQEKSQYPTLPSKYLALSDIEGNIEGLVMLLKGAKVMNDEYHWTFGDGHLYILGDMFDRGKYVSQCLWLIYKLEQEAITNGGKIHYILGNHDIMNLTNDMRYVDPKYFNNAEEMNKSLLALYDDNTEMGRWIRSKNIVEKAGNTLFLHGGISPQVADLKESLDVMNQYGKMKIEGTCTSNSCQIVTGGSASGLYWYRGMADNDLSQKEVNDITSSFNVDHIVIAHTIRYETIQPIYENKVIMIDLDHEENTRKGFMRALYYENGCYFDFYTSSIKTVYNSIIGQNCKK